MTEQTGVAGWRRERRREAAELRNSQQQVTDGKLQSHSHLTSMEPTLVSLKERNLKVCVRMTYLLFHHFPFTLFFPPPQPCLALQGPTSEGLCTPLPTVRGRKSAENHLSLPYAVSFAGALLSPPLALLRCSCCVFLSFFSSSALGCRRQVPCCLPLLCPPEILRPSRPS